MPEPIRASFKWTKEEHRRATKYIGLARTKGSTTNNQKQRFGVFVLAVIVFLIGGWVATGSFPSESQTGTRSGSSSLPISRKEAAIILSVFVGVVVLSLVTRNRPGKNIGQSMTFSIDSTGMLVDVNGDSENRYDWASVAKVAHFKDGLVFRLEKGIHAWLPFDSFAGDHDRQSTLKVLERAGVELVDQV